MRVKLDENIAASAVHLFARAGHDVDTVIDEGLIGATDPVVLGAASSEHRLLVTLDRGLGDVRAYPPGSHADVLVVRLDQQSPDRVREALEAILGSVDLEGLGGSIAVWRDGSLRVRRAPTASGRQQEVY